MNSTILISNLTNPTLLFFILGVIAVIVKSDLEVPKQTIKFISIYLLFSIGFKGGQELAHNNFSQEVFFTLLFGLVLSLIIPFLVFFLLKKKVGIFNAGAIAATYGSVSAVTFVASASYLEAQQISYSGHMVAVMAFMEAPAIIIGVALMRKFEKNNTNTTDLKTIIFHSFTNGSVLMIIGSLVIGYISDTTQAEGIKPFTTDIFKGFLSIFLLEMGMVTARRIKGITKYGYSIIAFAIIFPLLIGISTAYIGQFVTNDIGNRFMLAILAASASYIAVPASMSLAAPEADPGLYIPMALGLTFPINITIGMPIYLEIIR
jgi:hypothetical protein